MQLARLRELTTRLPNSKDAMIQTNGLDAENFRVNTSGFDLNKGVFEAEGRHPDTGKLLGFIHYEGKTGMLELANFGAELPLSSLILGYTTKRNHGKLAGGHGEGFKLAALALLRNGYAVHIEASGYYWNFHWGRQDSNQLYCKITAPRERAPRETGNATIKNGALRGKKTNICTDVKFTVGVRRGVGKKISVEHFQDWTKTTLDLCSVNHIIQSSKGKLLKDSDYQNRIYLKGLLLDRSSKSREFKYGYDLKTGTVNRDREWMRDHNEVAHNLVTIWEKAIETDEAEHLPLYINMHRNIIKWADVDRAEKYISPSFARKIWQFLCTENSEWELFYHDSHHGDSVGAPPSEPLS